MATLEIIGAPLSNFVRVVRMACHEKCVDYTLTPARPHSPEVNAISPVGKIPVMRHGDFVLAESRAICAYIDQAFPGPSLLPKDPKAAALAEQWISLVCTTIDVALLRNYVRHYFFPGTPDGKPDRPAIEAGLPKCREAFAIMETELSRHAFLAGDSFTLADIFLLPIVHIMPAFPETAEMMKGSPAVSAWFATVSARPSAQATVPPPRM